MWSDIRSLFARLIGAHKDEIGMVHCTKAGEQIAIDAVDHIKKDGNIVTNDLHFSGSLHNLMGLKKAGRDVRVVRAKDWRISLEDMKAAIDQNTALVNITLNSNINGHLEEVSSLAKYARQKGALIYADIIQAAGIVPLDMAALDIDIAACSCYKWLFGVYGAGFLYVKKSLQGGRIPDTLYPGRVHYNYQPWTDHADPAKDPLEIEPVNNASRYESGHVNYMGYCAAYEGLKFLLDLGVENALKHSVSLNRALLDKLDPKKYRCISPHTDRSPIITFTTEDPEGVKKKLKEAHINVTVAHNRIRVSPAIYSNQSDIDALAAVLNR